MTKIRNIQFIEHPILKGLHLNFCDKNNVACDTIILAGENGTGKSSVLNELYSVFTRDVHSGIELDMEIEVDGQIRNLTYRWEHNIGDNKVLNVTIDDRKYHIHDPFFAEAFNPLVIYSDVDTQLGSRLIPSVTGISLDESAVSRRTPDNITTIINQMLVDIQAMDDAAIARAVRLHPDKCYDEMSVDIRMPRFTSAFSYIFKDLEYSRIVNKDGYKRILFMKQGVELPIEGLSSGEKQIVYRGSFLLRDINALKGAFVLIDEPEISLHPKWQMKILNYYKNIFTDQSGVQTSQLIIATHSPFIIQNDNRFNDKVIVLSREGNQITVSDKPEYYICNGIEAIKDAFDITQFQEESATVYLEGRTDEKYFKSAAETYGLETPFDFEWVGHLKNGQEENTGKDPLKKAVQFWRGRNLKAKKIFLFDTDTNHEERIDGLVYELCMPFYHNNKGISIGIENALVLDYIDTSGFYSEKVSKTKYAEINKIQTLDKMKMCDHICSLPKKEREIIFSNLKEMIIKIMRLIDTSESGQIN